MFDQLIWHLNPNPKKKKKKKSILKNKLMMMKENRQSLAYKLSCSQ